MIPLGLYGAARPVASGLPITDSFDRANSTTTLGNTDTGQPWTAHQGTWGITGNVAYKVATAGQVARAAVDAGTSDAKVSAYLSRTATEYYGLVARYVDASNWIFFQNDGLTLRNAVCVIGGTSTVLWSSTGALPATPTLVAMTVSGSSWALSIAGTQVGSGTLPAGYPTGTRFGIWTYNTYARFNDFSIETP